MSSYIAERAKEKISSSDILRIASEAREDRQHGQEVIDGSIGMFFNEDRSFGGVQVIQEALKQHIADDLSYPSTTGSPEYREAILRWFLKDQYEKVSRAFLLPFGATLGGTGAVYIAIGTFLEAGEKVLLPDIMWGNYKLIAKNAGNPSEVYPLIASDGSFGIEELRKKIEELAQSQKHVLVIINDPCENPTGYCLSEEEYSRLFRMLNEEGRKTSLTVLFDIAYIDYDFHASVAPVFLEAQKKGQSFLCCFASSCSKSFGVYGLRCGALFAFTQEKKTADYLVSSIGRYARGIYSCPNGPALHAIAAALADPSQKEELLSEIKRNSDILSARGAKLLQLLDKAGIPHYPYTRGFFITLKDLKAEKICEELKKEHTYLVPLDSGHVRIALSGLTSEEEETLVSQLAEARKHI